MPYTYDSEKSLPLTEMEKRHHDAMNALGEELFIKVFVYNGKLRKLNACVRNIWFSFYSRRDENGNLCDSETRSLIVESFVSVYVKTASRKDDLTAVYDFLNKEIYAHPEGQTARTEEGDRAHSDKVSLQQILTDFMLHPALDGKGATVSGERKRFYNYNSTIKEVTADFTDNELENGMVDEAYLLSTDPHLYPDSFDELYGKFDEKEVRNEYRKLLNDLKENVTVEVRKLIASHFETSSKDFERKAIRRARRLNESQVSTCELCGQEYHKVRATQRYCSYFGGENDCYEQARRTNY